MKRCRLPIASVAFACMLLAFGVASSPARAAHRCAGTYHRTLVSIPGKDLSDPYVFRWNNDVRVYFVEGDQTGAATLAYMTSSDHAQTWRGPFDVPLPVPNGQALVEITGPVLAKSLDKQFPVVLIGGRTGDLGPYRLIAFEEL